MLASMGKVWLEVEAYNIPAIPAAAEVAPKLIDSINPKAMP